RGAVGVRDMREDLRRVLVVATENDRGSRGVGGGGGRPRGGGPPPRRGGGGPPPRGPPPPPHAARTSVVFGGDDENSSEVLAHIAHAYSAAGELDSAREVLREAMGCASRADSMTLIALVAHRTGATELAVSAVLAALSCPGWPVALQAVALLDKNAVGEVAATYIEQAARMTATGKAQLT
uniref:hypothetical protein n=1 Tax=Nocardia abscessus TaxID=120957 RepID=UPI002453A9F9